MVCCCAGCPQYADPTVPNPIRRVEEPSTNNDYFVYVPSRYQSDEPCPLVILCHGTTPWDTALRQIRDWVSLAEDKNFIVAAPKLKGTRGDLPPAPQAQIRKQRDDERTILATVRHVSGANHIDPTRVFLTGWSAGGYAVLHTGLRHPEIFRALTIMQGNFDARFVTDAKEHIDPYQPVYVIYGTTDVLTGGQSKDCMEWLYDHNVYVFDGQVSGPHRSHPKVAHEFFEKVIEEIPWLTIRATAADTNDPYTITFKARSSFQPAGYRWTFGEGNTSSMAEPSFKFEEGTHEVILETAMPNGKRLKRSIRVDVPFSLFPEKLDR
jgi:pimeloyl-ACP methyl ester carboxylesterase